MKIYTKTGDAGQTGLVGNERVSKSEVRIQAYGTLDELNSYLGLTLCALKEGSQSYVRIVRIQNELFELGSELAARDLSKLRMRLLSSTCISQLETEIDEMESTLTPLKSFILPGGCQASAHLHIARSVCRRAERLVVDLHQREKIRSEVLVYLNRLADYLFVIARFENKGHTEQLWVAPK